MPYGQINTDTIQSSTTGTAPVFKDGAGNEIGTLCRAWVNFNGVTTATIRASFNVSSVTRNATGDYTVTFTTALSDANYSVNTTAQRGDGAGITVPATGTYATAANAYTSITTTTVRVTAMAPGSGTALDVPYYGVSIFR